ncbi:hypothetical protein DE146DRAFT_33441 [Phaeosphaeria sp. MPI-PUGE-AT-0046c]|nr:hypothetical protein DE146DRAFT_33441 [Phaeosphaeria sp. MPI-PUGE-AT-0046c]
MSSETLLSELCSICNTNASKYRCPGCSARTCSLPCYKRHQQWAQCSGQRDPTKFVKKSQLVTPAGIDHDFNFLTGIERDIEKADKGLAENSHGSASTSRSWSQSQASQKGQTNYQHLEAAGVQVIRAPKGLSRQKENKSHRSSTKKSTGSRNIMWTVEWLDDRKKRMLTETSSTCQIALAHPFTPREQHKIKKRKRDTASPAVSNSPTIEDVIPTTSNQDKPVQLLVNNDIKVIHPERERSPSGGQASDPNTQTAEEVQAQLAKADSPNYCDDGSITEPMGNGEYRFFLLKPRTSSSKHVLIPLSATDALGDCLYNRTVLEFPTIYVFPGTLQPPSNDFMLEEDYLKQEGEEQKEFDALMSELDPEVLKRLKDDGQQPSRQSMKEEEVDSREILDVLKKDFGAVV